ncbi:DUF397 domain-containing protein [Streptomyces blastmyceticus]|uniref:DUF397 domain-containing protein n=1 Tax=Streptomyces blastmyceticus TaxID=68180 RepID=UPI0031D3545B
MSETQWQKSSYSTDGNECIELARSAGVVLMRESDTPDLIVTTTPVKLRAFLLGAKNGEFDHLT